MTPLPPWVFWTLISTASLALVGLLVIWGANREPRKSR